MISRVWIVFATLVFTSVARGQVIGQLSDSAAAAFYREHAKEYELESAAMKAAGGRVIRDAGRLRIQLANGRTLSYVDTLAEGDSHHRYLYQQYLLPQSLHDISMQFYEGGTHLLIHEATAGETVLPGEPVPSPNGQRFLSSSLDLDALYDPNRIEVWSVSQRGLRKELELDGGSTWGPDSARWLSNDVIRFVRVSMNQGTGAVSRAPRWIVRSRGQWRLSNRGP